MKYRLQLQYFGESGEGSQAAAGESGESTQAAAAPGENDQAAADEETFESLIAKGGKYKADFDKKVQGIISERVKESKAQKARIAATAPILQTLAAKYGVDSNDIDAIAKAVAADDSYIEEAAYEAGMTVEQYRNMEAIKQENERLRAAQEEAARQAAADQQIAIWQKEADELKQQFPTFDLNVLLQNEQARMLIGKGVSLKNTFIACNADNILEGAMAYTAQTVAQKTADTIASKGGRPRENGLSGQASASSRIDVSKLTNEQMAEINRRVMAGERIKL